MAHLAAPGNRLPRGPADRLARARLVALPSARHRSRPRGPRAFGADRMGLDGGRPLPTRDGARRPPRPRPGQAGGHAGGGHRRGAGPGRGRRRRRRRAERATPRRQPGHRAAAAGSVGSGGRGGRRCRAGRGGPRRSLGSRDTHAGHRRAGRGGGSGPEPGLGMEPLAGLPRPPARRAAARRGRGESAHRLRRAGRAHRDHPPRRRARARERGSARGLPTTGPRRRGTPRHPRAHRIPRRAAVASRPCPARMARPKRSSCHGAWAAPAPRPRGARHASIWATARGWSTTARTIASSRPGWSTTSARRIGRQRGVEGPARSAASIPSTYGSSSATRRASPTSGRW